MHLSDFSYVERFLQNFTLLLLFLVHLWYLTEFEDFRHPPRNTKTVVFFLTLGSFVGWLIVDALSVFLKYEEGRDASKNCMPKSHSLYSQSHQDILVGLNFFFDIVWTLQSSALFLLLVVIRNLAKPFVSLGSTWEFTAYRVWAIGSLIWYPAVTAVFEYVLTDIKEHLLLAAVVPQLINHAESLFIALVLWRSERKLRNATLNLSVDTRRLLSARFLWPTRFLIIFLLMDVIGLGAINIDIMLMVFAGGSGAIFTSAFASDFLISIFSLGITGSHLAVFYLLYPPRPFGGRVGTSPAATSLYDLDNSCRGNSCRISSCRSENVGLSGAANGAPGSTPSNSFVTRARTQPLQTIRVAPEVDSSMKTGACDEEGAPPRTPLKTRARTEPLRVARVAAAVDDSVKAGKTEGARPRTPLAAFDDSLSPPSVIGELKEGPARVAPSGWRAEDRAVRGGV